jgi:putative SOS response-associated peptidase YedK
VFKPLCQHGSAICFADDWYEWEKEGDKKQPCFIHRADGAVPDDELIWHAVTRAVGNVKN